MRTTQCPKCPLRFSTRSELLWHVRQDHRRTTGLDLPDRLCPPGPPAPPPDRAGALTGRLPATGSDIRVVRTARRSRAVGPSPALPAPATVSSAAFR